uniref:RxLR effector candidate protein n=1 Tax=Hyaloperonospora arabidopsidis (strain Emoy2) TaxID=559515 RepID=M4BH14_HYAAE
MKILAVLEGLQDLLGRLEVSQNMPDEEECMQGAIETGIFGSVLRPSFEASRMRVNALYHTPSRRGQVYKSPARPYFGHPNVRLNYGVRREVHVDEEARHFYDPMPP